MSILIIESNEAKLDKTFFNLSVVHCRNSLILANYLNADLISHESEIELVAENKYSHIICAYASGYMMYKKYFKILQNNTDANIFWLVNDHNVGDNPLIRMWTETYRKKYDMICNNERGSYDVGVLNYILAGRKINDWIDDWHTINLNCLIFDISFTRNITPNLFQSEKSDCVYYGTFRIDRINDMRDYNSFDYCISTSSKNILSYKNENINARFINKLEWLKGRESLYNFKYSIYFEDSHTHTNYAFMANRYYECIMLDVLVFFDFRCSQTISKSGYKIPEFLIVKNGIELREKIFKIEQDNSFYNNLIETQRSNFDLIINEKNNVLNSIKNILSVKKNRTEELNYEFLEKRKIKNSIKIENQLSLF